MNINKKGNEDKKPVIKTPSYLSTIYHRNSCLSRRLFRARATFVQKKRMIFTIRTLEILEDEKDFVVQSAQRGKQV